jgi:hypothetical protein
MRLTVDLYYEKSLISLFKIVFNDIIINKTLLRKYNITFLSSLTNVPDEIKNA